MPLLSEAVEASWCYFFENWFMTLKIYKLLKPLRTIIQQNYWSFYPSELIYFAFFTMRHPVGLGNCMLLSMPCDTNRGMLQNWTSLWQCLEMVPKEENRNQLVIVLSFFPTITQLCEFFCHKGGIYQLSVRWIYSIWMSHWHCWATEGTEFWINVCFIKICSKLSSVLLLYLLWIFMKQMLVSSN